MINTQFIYTIMAPPPNRHIFVRAEVRLWSAIRGPHGSSCQKKMIREFFAGKSYHKVFLSAKLT